MTYDPNWFYSSVAQASAAVVGLMGVILIPRLDAQITAVRGSRASVLQAIYNVRANGQQIAVEVEKYAKHQTRIAFLIDEAISAGNRLFSFPGEMDLFGPLVLGGPPTMLANKDQASERRANAQKAALILQELHTFANVNTCSDVYRAEKRLDQLRTLIGAQNESWLTQLVNSIVSLSSVSRLNARTASIRISGAMAVIIAWLCLFGMILPLAYLSAIDSVSKWVLLVAFGLGVLALPIYIAYELYRVRRLASVDLSTEDARREANKL